MIWEKLLETTRVRTLFGGKASQRSPEDLRSEFDRDYGRTVFSTPVRRLQDKAQVFPLVKDDFVRTRLTHSIEVSSVARTLGAWVAKWLVEQRELPATGQSSIEVVTATCGMLHDLGNPPFGHAGEEAICGWCRNTLKIEGLFAPETQMSSDFLGWNGNAQTIRLIGRLQVLADDYGLNLTSATMSTACKYIAASDHVNENVHDRSKIGYFCSEKVLIDKVREATGTGEARHPLTLLVEASDDIVYACVDLEDGIKKRLITWDQLEEEMLKLTPSCEHTKKAIEDAKELIGNSLQGIARDEGLIQAFRTYAIIEATRSAFEEFKKNYALIIGGRYHNEIVKDFTAVQLIKACKNIARRVSYESDEVLRVELMGRKVIQDILSIFWEGAESYPDFPKMRPFGKKSFKLMSSNYLQVFNKAMAKVEPNQADAEQLGLYYRLQLICDYVAGMTDSFATNLHKQLTNA
jgi:dGTPase